jgi:hypothetical protein
VERHRVGVGVDLDHRDLRSFRVDVLVERGDARLVGLDEFDEARNSVGLRFDPARSRDAKARRDEDVGLRASGTRCRAPRTRGETVPELDPRLTKVLAENVGLTDDFERAPLLVAGVQDVHLSALLFEGTARLKKDVHAGRIHERHVGAVDDHVREAAFDHLLQIEQKYSSGG